MGYQNITNIDISSVVIQQMAARNQQRKRMSWQQMDATEMSFDNFMYDVVLDKSVLDTFMCMKDRDHIIRKYLCEVRRVLKPGGTFLCLCFGERHQICPKLEQYLPGFSVALVEFPPKFPGGNPHYCYVCKL